MAASGTQAAPSVSVTPAGCCRWAPRLTLTSSTPHSDVCAAANGVHHEIQGRDMSTKIQNIHLQFAPEETKTPRGGWKNHLDLT